MNLRCGLQATHKWIVLLDDGRCVAIVKTSNIIHALYIKPAFGHFHLRWSYETAFHLHGIPKGVQQTCSRGRLPKRPRNGDRKRAFVLESRPSSVDVQKEISFITRRRRFPTIILILCQHLSQTEALWRILQIKTPRSLSIGWFKFRLNYHRANNSTPRSHLASSAAIFNLQPEISQSLFIGV